MKSAATGERKNYGKVAVLMGGLSAEREISLKSGAAVLAALRSAGVDAEALDSGEAGFHARLLDGGFARVFIALHGRGGEDGVMQGLLESAGMPYTGSGVLGSALAMDKLRTKQLWQSTGIPTPAFSMLTSAADVEMVRATLQYPVIVKPAHEGSSIGIARVDAAGEYTAGILGDTVLPLIKLETPNVFYDYAAKYQSDTTRYLLPCGLDAAQSSALQAQSLAAFRAVGASGWGRVDFMLDEAGQPWFIEVNTVPGLTDHSLVPMAAQAEGVDFTQLVLRILDTAVPANDAEVRHAG